MGLADITAVDGMCWRLLPGSMAAVSADAAWRVIVACALLMAAVIVLFLVVWYYRKNVLLPDEPSAAIWTFDDLRAMRDRGELSEEEYQTLRAAMIGSLRAPKVPETDAPGPSGGLRGERPGRRIGNFDLEKDPDA